MEQTYKEVRVLIKEPAWRKVKEKLKSSRYLTINELVRHILYEFAEKGDKND